MKKIFFGFLILAILAIPFLIQPRNSEQPILIARAEPPAGDEEESKFWSTFRKIFSKPEPSWSKSNSQTTQTTGVRGVDDEGKLKEKYDFEAVKWMENYRVSEEGVMKFLKARGLGPYQGKAGKGEGQ